MEEAHPLAVKLSFGISVGLLPVTLSLKTVSCGIRNSGLPEEEAGDIESSSKNPNQIPNKPSFKDFTFGDSFFCGVPVFELHMVLWCIEIYFVCSENCIY